ncbi:MAG: hypothetical protein LBD44_00945 [Spirochaetaceae bacterium]|jgi:hypothetical protein|nr:hypothetical protein [Spirochaetaceae bacterium]
MKKANELGMSRRKAYLRVRGGYSFFRVMLYIEYMGINSKRRKRRGEPAALTLTDRTRRLVRVALIICGALFIAAGIARGDAAALWQKAVFVCLECIGIG